MLAHNFQGYDSYFLMHEYQLQAPNYNQIRNGGKILELRVGKLGKERIRFIDSCSFLSMPLTNFASTFGFDENDTTLNLKKGYFPHFFNVPENQDYRGPLPAKHFYGSYTMSQDRFDVFERWYEQTSRQPDYDFDFRTELEAYCASDVRLLRAGCEMFRQEFQDHAHFDPFEHVTIAAACSRDLRKSRLQRDTIASEPVNGWRFKIRYSLAALEWLEYRGEQLGRPLQHVGNVGEHAIRDGNRTFHADGYDPDTNTLYEFYGCFWHGCRTCYPQARNEVHQQLQGRTLEDVYRAILHRQNRLQSLGYRLEKMWEHTWTRLKSSIPTLQSTIQSYDLQPPLHPRDAFFGGRTNAVRLYVENEQLHYYDFTSLYPWVNKYGTYPVGHPTFIYKPPNPQDISPYFGIAKCTVLQPSDLFLPYRCGQKLVFPLCRTSVETSCATTLLYNDN